MSPARYHFGLILILCVQYLDTSVGFVVRDAEIILPKQKWDDSKTNNLFWGTDVKILYSRTTQDMYVVAVTMTRIKIVLFVWHINVQILRFCRPEQSNPLRAEINFGKFEYIYMLFLSNEMISFHVNNKISQIAKFMGPTWGPPGSCRPQMSLMLAPWTLLSGMLTSLYLTELIFVGYGLVSVTCIWWYKLELMSTFTLSCISTWSGGAYGSPLV